MFLNKHEIKTQKLYTILILEAINKPNPNPQPDNKGNGLSFNLVLQ
jgi:hypothetical protein